MRTSFERKIDNPALFKQQLLAWSQQFREIVFLDSNSHKDAYSTYDAVLAADAFTSLQTDFDHAFDDLRQYRQTTKDWLFGYLSYDLKNDTEPLQSQNVDGLGFPDLFFFEPRKLFLLREDRVELQYLALCADEMQPDLEAILNTPIERQSNAALNIVQRTPQPQYISRVSDMLRHIHRGDIYEANFCIEFFAEQALIDPLSKFEKLNEISRAPFAAYFKNNAHFALCASPERYLKKTADKLISQPIKGTAPRFADAALDEQSRSALVADPKERSENIMITDLVRNDLSRTAQKGSVEVEELCGVYSFLQVHQLISTIVSKPAPEYVPTDLLKTTFPMGSMTGAPKIAAMQLIETLEQSRRGIYSGAIGYLAPNGDFDFNVVIRSIFYNAQKQYVSFSVGSAITALSDPESEYAECLLKARAMFAVLR